ncbi:MAG: hypothetical protein KF832_09765 [Caldilineaceae bacterium]|nr:hypothetical protein [Caldilineaceae bacterium]
MQKSMDRKLQAIRANPHNKEFIICYAADPDMGAGINPLVGLYPSLRAYHESLAALIEQAKLDIMLTSVSAMDVLAREWHVFDHSPVTPSIRANDATDIWSGRGFSYAKEPSRPFATTTIEEAQFGTLLPKPGQQPDVNLGLYSLTFNNDFESDWFALERLKAFRVEAVQKGFRYFIEVFNPNAPVNLAAEAIPHFVNDAIARMLAGIPQASRPEFLKIPYNGPRAMEELVTYTSTIVGILGGPASTTYDSYKLIAEAKKYGARVALFGRRIKDAADPLAFTEFLRAVADEELTPEEGVKAYHGALQAAGIPSKRSLQEDMVLQTPTLKA